MLLSGPFTCLHTLHTVTLEEQRHQSVGTLLLSQYTQYHNSEPAANVVQFWTRRDWTSGGWGGSESEVVLKKMAKEFSDIKDFTFVSL